MSAIAPPPLRRQEANQKIHTQIEDIETNSLESFHEECTNIFKVEIQETIFQIQNQRLQYKHGIEKNM